MMGKVDAKTQLMMVVSGLRGIVALALVMAMPSSSQEQIAAATMFVIFWTNIVLGGLTATLVPRLFEEHDGAEKRNGDIEDAAEVRGQLDAVGHVEISHRPQKSSRHCCNKRSSIADRSDCLESSGIMAFDSET